MFMCNCKPSLSLGAARRYLEVNQVTIAERMRTTQSAVSRIERQDDIHVSTLVKYVDALGGRLKLVLEYPDGDLIIKVGK